IRDTRLDGAEFTGEAAFDCLKTACNGAGAFVKAGFRASQIVGDAGRKGFAMAGKRFASSARRVGNTGFDRTKLAGEATFDLAKTTGNCVGAVTKACFRTGQIVDQAGAECLAKTVQSFASLGGFSRKRACRL